ncbi:hypothetical protein GCM10010218_64030 [Streptomyces mashuensis]|uniref:Uncharacterized protein n=1 Tax=Streptomyces mashuensis TaxID=33904 RepID=A0A919BAL5_9ACTN|nr:hypothetical protein [Streptomyces mashuensis]GHF74096.1 hypothetical protein GCM10010218_64030 [Streptomyces mashuensis]
MAYDPQIARVQSAAAQLTALTGAEPRIVREPGAVRIEADVTARLTRRWTRLVAVLELGTTYGLTDTETGQIAWLRFELGKGTRP